jgi:hypothetical protein
MNNRVSGTAQDFWYTLPTTASKEAFWRVWIDVSSWSSWDTPLKEARIEQAMGLGTRGQLITRSGQKSAFVITEFTPFLWGNWRFDGFSAKQIGSSSSPIAFVFWV